jgi:hypothetical protein
MRKQRTRQHIIEDLGFNHIERQILHAGFTVTRIVHNDYGYDAVVYTFNEQGEISSFIFHIQLKSTDRILLSNNKKTVCFDLSKQDLELWLSGSNKLFLALFDAKKEVAYYIDLQDYFKKEGIAFDKIKKFVRIHIPITHLLTPEAIKQIPNFKN